MTIPHQPKKVLETDQIIVYDDFLPQEEVERLYTHFMGSDYEYINTQKVSRAWKIRDQFPLRGKSIFCYDEAAQKPEADWVYPINEDLDLFIDNMNNMLPEVAHLVGRSGKDWQAYSVTQWIYQAGTGLSLHDDGANTYSGAYAYFLSKEWNIHWGGLLIVLDKETDKAIDQFKQEYGHLRYWKENWLDDNQESLLIEEIGLGQFVYPKFNRIVFIKNNAYHAVTSITPSAGDRTRKSLAGFFHIRGAGSGY